MIAEESGRKASNLTSFLHWVCWQPEFLSLKAIDLTRVFSEEIRRGNIQCSKDVRSNIICQRKDMQEEWRMDLALMERWWS